MGNKNDYEDEEMTVELELDDGKEHTIFLHYGVSCTVLEFYQKHQ